MDKKAQTLTKKIILGKKGQSLPKKIIFLGIMILLIGVGGILI